jgi:hypothetical protein
VIHQNSNNPNFYSMGIEHLTSDPFGGFYPNLHFSPRESPEVLARIPDGRIQE